MPQGFPDAHVLVGLSGSNSDLFPTGEPITGGLRLPSWVRHHSLVTRFQQVPSQNPPLIFPSPCLIRCPPPPIPQHILGSIHLRPSHDRECAAAVGAITHCLVPKVQWLTRCQWWQSPDSHGLTGSSIIPIPPEGSPPRLRDEAVALANLTQHRYSWLYAVQHNQSSHASQFVMCQCALERVGLRADGQCG